MDEIEDEALNHNAQTRKRKLAVVLTQHVIKQLHFLTETVNKIASKLFINSCESCKVNPSSVAGLENVEFMLEATGVDDSDDDRNYDTDDEDYAEGDLPLPVRKRRRPEEMPRHMNYVEVIHRYNDHEFQSHFRLTPDTFQWLCEKIGPTISTQSRGRTTTGVEEQVLMVLWLLATQDSYRSVATRFGFSKGTLHACFYRIIAALMSLAPVVISWPDSYSRRLTRTYFRGRFGFDGVVGSIDGTYVSIKAPAVHAHNYINRKCFYGITLQGTCDHRLRFIDAFTGYPSSVSDVRIFRNSPIYKKLLEQPRRYLSAGEFIIGDKAYEPKTFLVPPYKFGRAFRPWQGRFNVPHSQCRQSIERTFALLFGRFRRFKHLDMSRTDWISTTIMAGVVLHNLALNHGEPAAMRERFEREGAEFLVGRAAEQAQPDYVAPNQARGNAAGRAFRDALARKMGFLRDEDGQPGNGLPVYAPPGHGQPGHGQPGLNDGQHGAAAPNHEDVFDFNMGDDDDDL